MARISTMARWPPGLELDEIFRFLAPRAIPSIERIGPTTYVRSLRVDGRVRTLAVTGRDIGSRRRRLEIAVRPAFRPRRVRRGEPDQARALVDRMLDLSTEDRRFRRQVAHDSILGPLVAAHPPQRLIRYLDPFEGVVRAILGQQVSLAAARTMADRLVRLVGARAPAPPACDAVAREHELDIGSRPLLAFPAPADVLDLGAPALRGLGLTGAKAAAIVAVSDAIASGRIEWKALASASADEVHAALESVRGIGPWTAAYVRMRVLGDADAFLPTDMGVVKAMEALGARRRPWTTSTILARAERWRPWRAYATLYLWRGLG